MSIKSSCKCPEINDQDWHLKDLDWNGKFFYFEDLPHFFNIPLGLEKRWQMMQAEISHKGYHLINPEMMLYQPGMFQGHLLTEISDPEQYDANVIPFENARILTRLHRGPRSELSRAVSELKAFALDRSHIEPNAIYYWFTTCQKCAKTRGGDKTVLFARI